ncbi:dihydrodipicolinate reductase C-terminal domain-containing protein [Desertivirga arenae]|uniref:dihydrodipicolinate reductase C-terminal domain-containing protein n=1 Tax=Desertivirga arenae TaxID=2810309 RepID=UPI001A9702C9|nr:dihydrodipicolinate reductase C-terminal domain-containing protein [Pedobacter sp. SYSU D00823]
MKVVVVGAGKLANAILSSNPDLRNCEVISWDMINSEILSQEVIVVHAGSGRQLDDAVDFCAKTKSVLIELSTGLKTENMTPNFPLIICPNTSILLLKTISLLSDSRKYFEKEKIRIVESHQKTKTSAPGTAYKIAESLNIPFPEIESVREPERQLAEIGIPAAFLDRHAYHKIIIGEGSEQISIETKVLGHQSYVTGLWKIVEAVKDHVFENKRYSVLDLIGQNLI